MQRRLIFYGEAYYQKFEELLGFFALILNISISQNQLQPDGANDQPSDESVSRDASCSKYAHR